MGSADSGCVPSVTLAQAGQMKAWTRCGVWLPGLSWWASSWALIWVWSAQTPAPQLVHAPIAVVAWSAEMQVKQFMVGPPEDFGGLNAERQPIVDQVESGFGRMRARSAQAQGQGAAGLKEGHGPSQRYRADRQMIHRMNYPDALRYNTFRGSSRRAPLPLARRRRTSKQLVEAISGNPAGKGEPHRLNPKYAPADQASQHRRYRELDIFWRNDGPAHLLAAPTSPRAGSIEPTPDT